MEQAIIWLYIVNLSLLILHEIDSGYQQEWELFRFPGGAPVFLLLHIPLFIPLLYGLVLLERGTKAGLIFALVISVFGLGGFIIHSIFISRGDERFKSRMSQIILWLMLAVSLILGLITVFYLMKMY